MSRLFKCRIVREVSPGVIQSMTFIGPSYFDIPHGRSIQMRRVHTSPRSAA